MKTIQNIIALIFILSTLVLSACGGQSPAETKGPGQEFYGPGPSAETLDELYFSRYFHSEVSCKDTWVNKARSGDAYFAGFEIGSELVKREDKPNNYGSDTMVTYLIYLKTITIEDYLVNIPNQTVEYVGGSDAESSQALDPSTVLARANELAKTAPDLRAGILFSYNPTKLDTESWVDFGIQCDTTNSVIFTVPW